MDTPVRAQLEADLERDGRVLLPQKSIILGVAKAAKAVDRVQVVFDTIVTPEHKEISFRGIAMMPDGSQGLVGEVDLQKDKSTLAGVGAALSTTSRAAISAADPTGFGAQLGANVADETLQNMDKDLNQAGRVDRIISVNAYTPIQIFVDETF
jgi:type IV secretory pathway VirB10-like protein